MLLLLFVALGFILRGDFFYVLPCVILFLCFSCDFQSFYGCLFDLRLFGFVCFLVLLVSEKGYGL